MTTNEKTQDTQTEPLVINADTLPALIQLQIDETIARIRAVVEKRIQAQRAYELEEAMARHLARTFMGENPSVTVKLPCTGQELIDAMLAHDPKLDPKEPTWTNPRQIMTAIMGTMLSEILQLQRSRALNHVPMSNADYQRQAQALIERWVTLLSLPKLVRH